MPKRKTVPKFDNEDDERRFWATHDSDEYIDWSKGRATTFPRLRPSVKTISLRLPAALLNDLRTLANKRDVPYQSLLKVLLAQKLSEEMAAEGPTRKA